MIESKFFNQKNFSYALFLFTLCFFFYGFISEENSAGAGGFSGDFSNSWITLQTFINNDIFTAIKTSSNPISEKSQYISSRPPLIWILNKYLNPFTDNQIKWLRSIFFLSLFAPVLFYYCLKKKFPGISNDKLILLSSTLLLSPYFRTSSYWGLEENYGIIFTLISFIIFNIYQKDKTSSYKKFLKLFILTLTSSLCVYLDQKLLIIPLFFLIKIFNSKEKKTLKIFSVILFLIFAIPFIYLIFLWKNIIPTVDASSRGTGQILHLSHIGFTITILGFYFIPFFLFKKENYKLLLLNYFKTKKSFLLILAFIFYLIISFIFDNYHNVQYSHLGKGFVHKISILFFPDIKIQKLFVYLSFIFFYFVTTLFLNFKLSECLIVLYFIISSIFIHPLQQEYFDPLLLIIFFIFFNFKLKFYYKNIFLLHFYLLIFLFITKFYYLKKIPLIF
jgi:hypothetical protein